MPYTALTDEPYLAFLVGRNAFNTTPLAYRGWLDVAGGTGFHLQYALPNSLVWQDWGLVDPSGHVSFAQVVVAWTSITGTPTTLAGYGITDGVNAVTSDTNVTGAVAGHTLTLGWTGTLAAGRLNANVVQSVVNDTNVTGSISAQALTLGWTSTLAPSRGGLGFNASTVAKGGVLAGTGAGTWGITTVGADGTVLTADSTQTGGVKWGTAGTGTVTGSGTSTRVAFWSSSTALSSDAGLFWDNTNKRLGIGSASPSFPLHVVSTGGGVISQVQGVTNPRFNVTDGTVTADVYVAGGVSQFGSVTNTAVNITTNDTVAIHVDTSQTVGIPHVLQFTANATFIANGTICKHTANGLFIAGVAGSVFDFALTNPSGTNGIILVPTGTLNVQFPGLVTVGNDIQWSNDTGFGLLSFVGGNRFLSYTSAGGVALGKVGSYISVATAGAGLTAVRASGRLTGQTSSAVTIATFTPGADGEFLVTGMGLITSVSGGVRLDLTWTDPDGGAHTLGIIALAVAAGQTAGTVVNIRASSGVAITVKATITGGSPTYNASANIIQVA